MTVRTWVGTAVAAALAASATAAPKPRAWRALFDGRDLAGWEVFLTTPNASGPPTPRGIGQDPNQVMSVVDGTIRISGQESGALTTLESFHDYELRLEFKWGEKKWPPREQARRNSGVVYHAVGPHGAHSGNWMRGLQSQVQEGNCGDLHSMDGVSFDVEAETADVDGGRHPVYTPGAPVMKGVKERVVKSGTGVEKPNGEWNVMEVVARGDTVEHRVNGRTVLRATNVRQVVDGQPVPLAAGRIQLQSEGFEVFYRKIEIRPLD